MMVLVVSVRLNNLDSFDTCFIMLLTFLSGMYRDMQGFIGADRGIKGYPVADSPETCFLLLPNSYHLP